MPQLIPVDFDPFAAPDADASAPPPSAPSSPNPGLISFSSPPPAANDAAQTGAGPRLIPVDHDPFAASSSDAAPSDDARPLTIRRGSSPTLATPIAGSAPALPADFTPSSAPSPAPQPAATAASPPLPAGGISYEDAVAASTPNPGGALSNAPDDSWTSSALKGAGTAVLKGLSDVPGVFGNAMDMGDYLVARAQAKITGEPVDSILAKMQAATKAGGWTDPRNWLPSGQQVAAPALSRTGEYVPTSEAGKIAMAAGEAATGGALTPGMGGLKALLPNAIAGAAGQGATDLTGDPLYGLGAGLIAAPAAEAVAAGTAKLAGPIVQGVRALDNVPVVGPAIQRAVDRKAAGMVLDASSDPAALRQWAAAPPAPDAVPNSPNTTAAAVGNDQGLFEAEKAARNAKVPTGGDGQPAPSYFNQVDTAKSNAQVAALQGTAPAGADVMRPGQVLGARMDAIDTATQDAIDRLQAAHQDAVAGRAATSQTFADQQNADLAGRVADRGQDAMDAQSQAMAQRQAAHDALVQGFQDAQDRQLGAAQSAAAPLGGRADVDDLGATLRNAEEEVRSGAKALHRDLYSKVDPDGTLALVASPVAARASSIVDGLKANSAELTPAEAPLFRRAAALPDVATYGTIHALDVDVGAAMSAERRTAGESPAWARLTQLKGAVKGAMSDAVDNQVAHESRQVAAGQMAPEDTIAARLGLSFGVKADDWNSAAEQAQARAYTGTGGRADPGAGTIGFSGAPGEDLPGRGRSGGPARDPGLSPSPRGAGQGASQAVGPRLSPIADDVARQAVAAGRPVDEARAAGALQDAYYRTRAARFSGARGTAEDLYRAEAPTIGSMRGDADFLDDRAGASSLADQMNARLGAAQDAAPARPASPAPSNPAVHPDLIEAGNHVIHRVLVGDDTRFYRAYQRPAGGLDGVRPDQLGDRVGSVAIGRHPDGRWEVGNVTVPEANRRQGIARTMYGAIEKDLGITMRPSGQLQPDGYAMWLARDPDAVKWHREVDGAYWSPKALASAYESPDIGPVGQATRAAYDALPAEAKTPEALRSMFQGGADGPRGQIRFAPGERPQIGVGGRADASTIPHEMSHAWFEDLLADAKHPAAPAGLKADAQTLLGHVGSTDGTLNPAQHEQLAQGLEQYLRDGRAPTPALGRVFQQFKDWLGRVYQTMRGPGAPVGDDVRGVYGRMLDGGSAPRDSGVGPDRFTAPFHDDTALDRAPPRPDMPRPETLAGFIRRNGKMQDPGGDLASMGLGNLVAKAGEGLHPDKMREAAAEAGYLGGDTARAVHETTVNDLLARLEDGGKAHSVVDDEAAHAWAQYDDAKAAYDRGRSDSEGRSGFGGKPAEVPLSAYSVDDVYGADGMPLPGMSASRLAPTFDRAADNRLKAANAAYAEYAKTYKNPTVGPGLRTTGYAGQYQRSNSAFIKGAVRSGPEGYDAARAHLRAAANDPAAIGAMHEAVLNPLRKTTTGNGTITPAGLARWKSADGYGPALKALDEVSPRFSSRFDTAAEATQALVDLGAQHKAALEAYQAQAAAEALAGRKAGSAGLKAANSADTATTRAAIAARSAGDAVLNKASLADRNTGIASAKGILAEAKASPAGRFAKATSNAVAPSEVENAAGGFLKTGTTGATRMRGLVQSLSNDPDALAGLRKAGTDWMVRSFVDDGTGELSAAKFIGFLKDNGDVLRELYPHDQVSTFGAVARDAEAGIKWRTATAIKGGSDTVKNLHAVMGKAGEAAKHVSLGMVAMEALSDAMHGDVHRAMAGGSAAAVAYLGNSLRSAGIRRTADLYREMMANPELARTMISKMPAAADSPKLHNVARLLKRSLIVGPTVGAR